jgi:3-oxoacyl-[acyl-carrier protein] reductase
MELEGKVALVTGGGTGVGRATVLALARAGARGVIVNYSRSADEAEATAAEAHDLGADAIALQADVADESQVIRLVHGAGQHFGRLDVLVNNAGTTRFIPHSDLDALTDEVWDTILAVNLKGAFYCARAAAPELRRARGAIVNVASIAGLRGAGSSIPYMASKAALLQLTRGLAIALAPDVTVNAVAPGLVSTRWFRKPLGEEGARAFEDATAARTPLREVTKPEHVAQAVLGLLRMDKVTGEVIVVDGGLHATYG